MGVEQEQFDALCRQKLSVFSARALKEIEPSTNYKHNWHVDCVSEHLQAVWDNDIKRLIINVPPRTLKTHLSSVSFPSWGFGQDPTVKFLLTSFKFDLAKKMTRKTRLVMESNWYKQLNPHVGISSDQNEKHYFETTRRGHYYSASMSSVTGEGCDIQICDDPLNPDEAASPVQRQNVIDTIRGTLFSRFNDEDRGRFILIMQRLNEDDPTGELLKDEGWVHLKLPAEAVERSFSYSLGGKTWELKQGDLLFPGRLSKEVLERKAIEMGPYNYAGQMLQEPRPLGGGEIKKEYLNYFVVGYKERDGVKSTEFDVRCCNIYIIVDPAKGTEEAIKNDNDYTAMVVWALAPDQNYYLIDGIKERLNPTERLNKLFELHRKWNELSGGPPRVGYEDIGMMADNHFILEKQREESYRFSLVGLPQKGMKRIKKIPKIRRLIPLMEQGRVWLVNDLHYTDYKGLPRNFMSDIVEQEMLLFPFAPHDDFLDAMSMLLDMNPIFPKLGSVETSDGLSWGPQEISVLDI